MLAFARISARTAQRHVKGLAIQFVGKILHILFICDAQAVQHEGGMLHGKLLQLGALLWLPGRYQHLLAVGGY
jgi:hypothetical protein